MRFEEINPFVRQALISKLNDSNLLDIRTKIKTVDCRLFYIISGSGTMTIEGTVYSLIPGTAILFSAGTEYIWIPKDVKYYSVNFDYTHNYAHINKTFHPIHSAVFEDRQIIERPLFEDLPFLNRCVVVQSANSIERMMEQITTEYCFHTPYTDSLLSTLLKAVIISLIRQYTNEENKEKNVAPLVKKIVEYINENYEKPLTSETFSSEFHFNSTYLNRIFKLHLGCSLHDFVISRRISAAMEILRSQNIPISEVAFKCGFNSINHFIKTFKKRIHLSPTEYRKCNI
ncbi:MAG: helix-turn-helix domain-containing protein [Clostridia bacterium]|nr:helix-turn-helix domain-containing protein [Clostridia bacterium]